MGIGRNTGAFVLCAVSIPAAAGYEPIPTESGWSGYINVGLNAMDIASNMIAEAVSNDISDDPIQSLDSPDSNTVRTPSVTGELNYSFAERRTQMFFGRRIQYGPGR